MSVLSANERWMLQADQVSPFNFVIGAHLQETPTLGAVNVALGSLVQYHGILRAEIDANGPPSWRLSNQLPSLEVSGGSQWTKVLNVELNQPFVLFGRPLFRVRWIRHREGCTFLLSFHHAVGDGRFGMGVLHDFLGALVGEVPTRGSPNISVDPAIPSGQGVTIPSALDRGRLMSPLAASTLDARKSIVLPLELAGLEDRRWPTIARGRGATLHGIVSATHLQAVAAHMGKAGPLSVSSPIDLRARLTSDLRSQARTCLGDVRRGYWTDPNADPWILARRICGDLNRLRDAVAPGSAGTTAGFDAEAIYQCRASCAVSNLGGFTTTPATQSLGLKSLVFGVSCSVLGDSILAVVGCGNVLSLTYCAMVPTLDLRSMRSIAQDSVRRLKRALDG